MNKNMFKIGEAQLGLLQDRKEFVVTSASDNGDIVLANGTVVVSLNAPDFAVKFGDKIVLKEGFLVKEDDAAPKGKHNPSMAAMRDAGF